VPKKVTLKVKEPKDIMAVWRQRTEAKMQEVLALVAKHTVDEMRTLKSGVWYPGLPNPSSAPDEYPAIQHGPLSEAISDPGNWLSSWSGYKITSRIGIEGTEAEGYGNLLDAGMRPWRARAMEECEGEIQQILGEKLVKDLGEGIAEVRWRTRWDS
jgi:hypothetical protein